VRAAIREAGERRAILCLSGGEPTLNPRLADYVALGKAAGVRRIELQTNAIRLGDGPLCDALAAAGLDEALVSLHAATAEISDAVTAAPGTFVKTVAGLDRLARSPVRLRLNFVFCRRNAAEFPAVVDLVAARWPAAILGVSVVGSHTDVVPRTTELIPRFSEIATPLGEGLRRARAAGITVTGFESMCGMPLCLVPPEAAAWREIPELPPGEGEGEFVKPDACRACALAPRCFGLRRGYVELYGGGEVRPVAHA
jgi:pyruvate-formate lyase-activating enzyme